MQVTLEDLELVADLRAVLPGCFRAKGKGGKGKGGKGKGGAAGKPGPGRPRKSAAAEAAGPEGKAGTPAKGAGRKRAAPDSGGKDKDKPPAKRGRPERVRMTDDELLQAALAASMKEQ